MAASATALTIEPTDRPLPPSRAIILYTIHDSDGASRRPTASTGGSHRQLGALATRFDAELELGRVADAEPTSRP